MMELFSRHSFRHGISYGCSFRSFVRLFLALILDSLKLRRKLPPCMECLCGTHITYTGVRICSYVSSKITFILYILRRNISAHKTFCERNNLRERRKKNLSHFTKQWLFGRSVCVDCYAFHYEILWS